MFIMKSPTDEILEACIRAFYNEDRYSPADQAITKLLKHFQTRQCSTL